MATAIIEPLAPVVTAEVEVWLVMGEDGNFGAFATEALAEEHRSKLADPDAYAVERDVLRTEPMREVFA